MSAIVNVSKPASADPMVATCTASCFVLACTEAKEPSSYAFLKQGSSMPVVAGESYDIYHWYPKHGTFLKSHLVISNEPPPPIQ